MSVSIGSVDKLLHKSFLLLGETGTGKSSLIKALIGLYEEMCEPKDFKYALFDMKQVEFIVEDEDYHRDYLRFGVVHDPRLALERLEHLGRICDMRTQRKVNTPAVCVF